MEDKTVPDFTHTARRLISCAKQLPEKEAENEMIAALETLYHKARYIDTKE